MSKAHDVRRHLLKARMETEKAIEILDENPSPEHIQEHVAEAHRKVTLAEAQAAIWAEA